MLDSEGKVPSISKAIACADDCLDVGLFDLLQSSDDTWLDFFAHSDYACECRVELELLKDVEVVQVVLRNLPIESHVSNVHVL